MLKIIGLGNILRGDDGIGPVVIDELRNRNLTLPLQIINAGADAFSILDELLSHQPLVIIDCARMGKQPGALVKFKLTQSTLHRAEKIVSLHGFGFHEIYYLAQQIGQVAECTIIGVEPKSTELNTGLSAEVSANIPRIIQMVMQESKKYAQKSINN